MAETFVPKTENALDPITALAFLRLRATKLYLLAGEGQYIKVFDDQGKWVLTQLIFDSQAIHGIACNLWSQDAENSGTLLVWGGRSICLVSIEADLDIDGEPLVKIRQRMPEVLWDDWILDGCFRPVNIADSGSESNTVEAFLVTAHNDLLRLKFVNEMTETRQNRCLYRIASGPSSILYSAHILWADAGQRLLIAAGTVFGECLLWSIDFDKSATPEVYLHYRFTGHQGSVFGIRISEVVQTDTVKRILASCSDDRTIRIWNISDTGSQEKVKQLVDGNFNGSEAGFLEKINGADSSGCLATIMGHASRIWGLRFLIQKDACWDLMSYGEDSTAQAWRVSLVPGRGKTSSEKPHDHAYRLSHQATYAYHSGKSIWAMPILQKAREDCIVATGGADGRITTYKPLLHEVPARKDVRTSQYTMEEVLKALQTTPRGLSPSPADKADSLTEQIFCSLKGSWKLLRNLDSLASTYPSGALDGIATFAERPPTDDEYDNEYLYSESGEFITQRGLKMKATRQYVYRYSRTSDAISVWFVKPDGGSAVDYFFHKLDFRDTSTGIDSDPEVWSASGYHLCVADNYNAIYSFRLRDSKITEWHAVFDVDGPKKDYTAKATYTRNQAEKFGSEEPEYVLSPSMKKNQNGLGKKMAQNNSESFKTYVWISENEVLTTTEQGHLFVGTLASNPEANNEHDCTNMIWEHVGHQRGLGSSCIATSIPSLGIALLTGTDGTIYLYSHRSRELDAIGKVPGKAGFLKAHILSQAWHRWWELTHQGEMVGVFATCLGSSQATVFMFSLGIHAGGQSTEEEAGFPAIQECYLTLRPTFIVTSSCFLDAEKWIILGSRNGDMAMYDLAHTTPNLALDVKPSCYESINGEDAITLIQFVPHDVSKPTGRVAIITAGRDGRWAIHYVFHKIEKTRLLVDLETIHVGVPPFGPIIEGACIDSTTKDLLLWGFRSKHFVVWNESQKAEVMAVDAGNAHRNRAYIHRCDGNGGGSFVYTKASVCHVHSQTRASHQVIQHGGHGREVKAMALSPAIKTSDGIELRLVATGAEDTAIRIFDLNADLKCLSVITKHTTGIQQLRWSPDGQRLFSAAGCEEFFVWRLQSAPLVTIGVVCEAQCPTVTEEVDLRIMDFAMEEIHNSHHEPNDGVAKEPDYLLSMVYSNSSVRIFCYHTSKGKQSFELLTEGSYTTYCLTQATHLHIGDTLSGFCTASTDGHLAFWPLPDTVSRHNNDDSANQPLPSETQRHTLYWSARTAIHQISVKALDHVTLSQSENLIVTGGDDGAIAFTRVGTRKLPEQVFETASLLIPSAHASAVTGVAFLGKPDGACHEEKEKRFMLASVGNDQRLKIWEVGVDMQQKGVESIIKVSRIAKVYTSIADASSLGTHRDAGGQRWLLVAGIGMERWRVGDGDGG